MDAPVGRDEAEQRSLERELRSDEESPLHIPLEVFMTAYYERYERVKGMASFLSDDRAVGPEDAAAAVEAQLAGDADYRAQAFAFIEGFVCFQQSFSRLGIVRTNPAPPRLPTGCFCVGISSAAEGFPPVGERVSR